MLEKSMFKEQHPFALLATGFNGGYVRGEKHHLFDAMYILVIFLAQDTQSN